MSNLPTTHFNIRNLSNNCNFELAALTTMVDRILVHRLFASYNDYRRPASHSCHLPEARIHHHCLKVVATDLIRFYFDRPLDVANLRLKAMAGPKKILVTALEYVISYLVPAAMALLVVVLAAAKPSAWVAKLLAARALMAITPLQMDLCKATRYQP